MLKFGGSRLTSILDGLTGIRLLMIACGLTVGFSFCYWILSLGSANPPDGLHSLDGAITFGDALYFSIVTETTLGYGDLTPKGTSRFLASVQVISGLLLGGVIVAKITSLPGRNLRLVTARAAGDWIEFMRTEGGQVLITFITIKVTDCSATYSGGTYRTTGEPAGFFVGELIDVRDDRLRFEYSNRDSNTDFFTDGIASLLFTSESSSERYSCFMATAHDFGSKCSMTWEGIRPSADEIKVIHGTDIIAKLALIKNYAEKCVRSTEA